MAPAATARRPGRAASVAIPIHTAGPIDATLRWKSAGATKLSVTLFQSGQAVPLARSTPLDGTSEHRRRWIFRAGALYGFASPTHPAAARPPTRCASLTRTDPRPAADRVVLRRAEGRRRPSRGTLMIPRRILSIVCAALATGRRGARRAGAAGGDRDSRRAPARSRGRAHPRESGHPRRGHEDPRRRAERRRFRPARRSSTCRR